MFSDRVMRRFRRSDKLIERWSREKIAAEKKALEDEAALVPPDETSIEHNMRLVDWLMHRYLADDDTRTEAEWQRSRCRIEIRMRKVMAAEPVDPLPPPIQVPKEATLEDILRR
jgi:hypothetical protein